MRLPAVTKRMTSEEYLAWEALQPDKHEYVDGEVFQVHAMVGATRRHVTVAGNLFAELSRLLEGSPCRAYMSDMKLQVLAANAWFYPDVVVTCDPADHVAEQAILPPSLIIEVLSPATAGYDRGEKFAAYRTIPSLREYAIVSPEAHRLELFRRDGERFWVLHDIPPQAPLVFQSLSLEIPWQRVFRNAD